MNILINNLHYLFKENTFNYYVKGFFNKFNIYVCNIINKSTKTSRWHKYCMNNILVKFFPYRMTF